MADDLGLSQGIKLPGGGEVSRWQLAAGAAFAVAFIILYFSSGRSSRSSGIDMGAIENDLADEIDRLIQAVEDQPPPIQWVSYPFSSTEPGPLPPTGPPDPGPPEPPPPGSGSFTMPAGKYPLIPHAGVRFS